MKLVLAGNFEQFKDYCNANNLRYNIHPIEAIYVYDLRNFGGWEYDGIEFIKIGTWYKRPLKLIREFRNTEMMYRMVNKKRNRRKR